MVLLLVPSTTGADMILQDAPNPGEGRDVPIEQCHGADTRGAVDHLHKRGAPQISAQFREIMLIVRKRAHPIKRVLRHLALIGVES